MCVLSHFWIDDGKVALFYVHRTYPMEQPQSLPDVVKGLAAKVASECFLLTVRRGHIMEDTLRGVRRSTYEPSKKLKVFMFPGMCSM